MICHTKKKTRIKYLCNIYNYSAAVAQQSKHYYIQENTTTPKCKVALLNMCLMESKTVT